MNRITINQFLNHCKSGDLLLFEGKKWYSKLIEWFLGSSISHVGMVVCKTDGKYLLESELCADGTKGVRLTRLETIMKKYTELEYNKIYARFLHYNRDTHFDNIIEYICYITLDRKYDSDPLDWIKIVTKVPFGNIHKTNSFVCSALVAYSFIQLRFLEPNIPWTILTPDLFSSTCNKLNLKCNLSNDILIELS